MLLEAMNEHSRQQRSLWCHRCSGPEVHGIKVRDDGRVGWCVGGPIGVSLEHALYGRVVSSFRQ